ncbi:MAG TPA: FAD-binding oxidoreductase [Kofleriaceae bacterium]|nr:FAD-binding oxidoreductase [Kofleriaceae bacterium]
MTAAAPSDFLAELRATAPALAVLTGDDCAPFQEDIMQIRGRAALVALPASRDEVRQLVQAAVRHKVALVAQGARTGLVGGAVPDATGRQCVVSFQRMARVRDFNVVNRSITVEPGLRLSQLAALTAEHDLHFPIDIGADATVGGVVATNAGGSRLLKYGDVRRNVLGLEVVLADAEATVVDVLAPLRKDNAGLDVKQLFIGGNGTLGLITAVALDLKRRDRSSVSIFVSFRDLAAAASALPAFEAAFGDMLGAFELISSPALRAVLAAFPHLRSPLAAESAPCFALIDVATSMPGLGAVLAERAHDTLASLHGDGRVVDAALGVAERFWAIRDSLPLAVVRDAVPLAFDVGFARDALAPFMIEIGDWLAREHPRLRNYEFGHFGDGGCHLTVAIPNDVLPEYGAMRQLAVRSAVYERVCAHGGSISAEHGMGPLNIAYYRKFEPAAVRALGERVQGALDPARVLGRIRYG